MWDGERFLLVTKAPADPVQLRSLETARGELGTLPPSRATATLPPAPDHPWRQSGRRSKINRRLTESVTT
ncbi:MAG: hypothetical protein WD830_06660 [Chloroflexota bacterium]